MNKDMLPDHLSYSQVSSYLMCPLRYKFRYIDQLSPEFISAPLAFGTAIHEAVGAFYHQHLLGEDLRPDQMVEVYRHAWSEKEPEEIRFFNGDDAAVSLAKAKQLLSVFHASFDPSVGILGVEEFFSIDMGKRIPPLHGYIDVIEHHCNGSIVVADLKTAARKPSDTQVAQNIQLTAYSLGAAGLGFDPETLDLRLDVLVKTKEPQMVRMKTTRTYHDRQRFVKLAKSVWKGIKRDVWFPNHDWHCNQCSYSQSCKDW